MPRLSDRSSQSETAYGNGVPITLGGKERLVPYGLHEQYFARARGEGIRGNQR